MFNSDGNFYGTGIPTGAGVNSTTNANGDSCDIYYNILMEPQFVNLWNSNFNLLEISPCIDAGDPALPNDPDGTVRDIGALPFFHCPVFVNISSTSPVIMIPGGGGSFDYDIEVVSNYFEPYTFDFWTEAIMPDSSVYGPILSRSDISIPVGGSIQRSLTQFVPGGAPSGFYYLVANVGFLPDSVLDYDEIPFMKFADDGAPTHNFGWQLFGWDGEIAPAASVSAEYAVTSAYPNPFNPETKLTFALPNPGDVSLIIYDIQGREIVRLAYGWLSAGSYEYTWKAGNLPSGVYFAKLTAGNLHQTQKLLLLK